MNRKSCFLHQKTPHLFATVRLILRQRSMISTKKRLFFVHFERRFMIFMATLKLAKNEYELIITPMSLPLDIFVFFNARLIFFLKIIFSLSNKKISSNHPFDNLYSNKCFFNAVIAFLKNMKRPSFFGSKSIIENSL